MGGRADGGTKVTREASSSPIVQLTVVGTALVLGLLPLLGPAPVILAVGILATSAVILWFQRFDVLLHLLVLSIFVESVGIGPASVGRVLAVAAVATVLARALLTSWQPRLTSPAAAGVPVLLFVVWAWTSGLWATDTRAWVYAMGQLGVAMAYFVTFALFIERRRQIFELLRTMVIGAMFSSAVAFAQVSAGAARAEGLQGDPNIYAMYQVAALPAAAMLATTAGTRRGRWLSWLSIPVLLASVVVTDSRGGLLTALGVLVLLVARGDLGHRLRRQRTATVAVVLTAAVSILVFVMTNNKRFTPERILSDRASGRLDIWYVAFREWQDHALFGIGGGGFKPRSVELLLTEPGVQLIKSHLLLSSGIEVHNIYLETLVEYGAIGCLLFVLLLISTGWRLQRATRYGGDPALRALPTILAAFLAASFFLSVVNNKLLWMLIALGVVVAGRTPLPEEDPAELDPGAAGRFRLTVLPRPFVTLVVAMVVPTVMAAGVATLLPDRHTASAEFVVSSGANPNEQEALVRTLLSLASSRVVAQDVVEQTGTDLPPQELLERLTVARPEGALVFTVAVKDVDPVRARRLMASIVDVYSSRVSVLQQAGAGDNSRFSLRAWGGGQVTTTQAPPPVLGNAAMALSLGVALALLLMATARRRDSAPLPAHVPVPSLVGA